MFVMPACIALCADTLRPWAKGISDTWQFPSEATLPGDSILSVSGQCLPEREGPWRTRRILSTVRRAACSGTWLVHVSLPCQDIFVLRYIPGGNRASLLRTRHESGLCEQTMFSMSIAGRGQKRIACAVGRMRWESGKWGSGKKYRCNGSEKIFVARAVSACHEKKYFKAGYSDVRMSGENFRTTR